MKGADYPSNGEQHADLAGRNGAGDGLAEALRGMGEVNGPDAVMKERAGDLGGAA